MAARAKRADAGGRGRAVIEAVSPSVDDGRFPVKRVAGEHLEVEARIFGDGHDRIGARLLWKRAGARRWAEEPMQPLPDDIWRAGFTPAEPGRYLYTILAWVDHFATWREDLRKRCEAGQDVDVDLKIGAALVRDALETAPRRERGALLSLAELLERDGDQGGRIEGALSPETLALMERCCPRKRAVLHDRDLPLMVDRDLARFSAWYELFPRSCSPDPGRHGTFRDVERRLPYVAELGFDILYLPPIHPIGLSFRKGRNNSVTCEAGDPGSPWAIGAREGGHTAIHPDLGTGEDFRRLVAAAADLGIEVALDIAFQASPDHPWAEEHPSWFKKRPDGTIQYAENPPKKYQDIYPFDFESEEWRSLWEALKGVFDFWIGEGVKIFRVDNPHTKPFRFWEWCVEGILKEHPDVILLSEAFTRPSVMYRLAKLGFNQSYTYFPWRNGRREIEDYFTELSRPPVREFFRGSHWTNTPDILTEPLQRGGPPAFASRFVLAATLGASYGVYGPAFELCENRPIREGSEEYLDSEKYQIRHWDLDRKGSLRGLIARVNAIRRDSPMAVPGARLRFHPTDNEMLLCYSWSAPERTEALLVVVNLDSRYKQSGWVDLALEELRMADGEAFEVHDLLSEASYGWKGRRNYVELDPRVAPAHIFRTRCLAAGVEVTAQATSVA